ncbi:helix-turn-helix domain-containing protein [Reichenbachiella versicolor]|uniref:helix-turn-helix domain-containing protein n=1 Tax=Reichenbachiella versicolor TaxID=1821036 RepID=UPI000D6E2AC3|nr:helix-turn-helix transcriptional regulator [Reichenbachiella versicolor]
MSLAIDSSWEFEPKKYILETAVPILKSRFDMSQKLALDVLAKSLLFESINDFYEEYTPDEDGYYSDNQLIFSEFVLAQKLNLCFEEAYRLKQDLDYFYCYHSGISAGNINFANFGLMKTYSYQINQGNEARLMFDYPLGFYCRIHNQKFEFDSGRRFDIEALWCDGFSFHYSNYNNYFVSTENMLLYVRTILEILLSYNHLVISNLVVTRWFNHHNYLYTYLIDNFETHRTYVNWKEGIDEHGLFIPKGSKSLETKLGLTNPLQELVLNKTTGFSLGQRLQYWMTNKCVNQKELSVLSQITTRTIRDFLKDVRDPDLYTIKKICTALNISLANFFQEVK